MKISEFDDAYEDKERIRGAIFSTTISELKLRTPILVDAAATVDAAVHAMNEHHTGCVLVQKGGKLVGVFTERDVIMRTAFQENSAVVKVEAVMTKSPETLEPTDNIAFALNKMSVGGYRHIPIVDGKGTPVGVLSVRDIVDFLADLFPQDILNLPPGTNIARSQDGG
jgi:CBS domain-containing protein